MKKRVSVLLAAVFLITALACAAMPVGAAAYGQIVVTDGVSVDGDLADWQGVEKTTLSVRQADGSFAADAAEYFQTAASPDSLYFAVVVKDSAKSCDGLVRDQIRLSVVLPDGSVGILFTDCDTMNVVKGDTDAFPWWGAPADKANAFIPDNSFSKFVYNEDGTVTVEIRACLRDTLRSQLAEGATLKVAISYVDNMNITNTTYDGTAWHAYGTTDICAVTADKISGEIKLGTPVVQEVFTYEATACTSGAEADIDGDFWEWNDAEDWKAPEKYALDVWDAEQGVFVKSDSEYVQFRYTYGFLYFHLYAADANGRTVNGLVRDLVRLTVFFPEGEMAFYYFDSDNWFANNTLAWFITEGGFDGTAAEAQNAAILDNSNSSFVYDDGHVEIEGRINCRDTVKDYFVHGTELKVAISYMDTQTCNNTAHEGGHWVKWGTTETVALTEEQVSGKVTLNDPSYQDTSSMEIQEPTAGAVNKGYSFDATGGMTVKVTPFAGASSYRVNVFDRWPGADGDVYIPNKYVDFAGTEIAVEGLIADVDSTYQVIAFDDNGNVVAVYPAIDFVVGENESDNGNGDNGNNGESNDNDPPAGSGSDSDTPVPDSGSSKVPDTGVAASAVPAALLALSAAGFALTRKHRAGTRG